MKEFNALRTLSESAQTSPRNENVDLVSEAINDIVSSLEYISTRVSDEDLLERFVDIAEELAMYNKYFTIAEDCILNEYESSMLPAIAESFRTGDSFEYTYDDGETVEITPEIAEDVIDIYDNLDENNKAVFAAIIAESADDLEEVLNYFAEEEELDESHYAGLRDDERKPKRIDDTPDENRTPKQGLKIAKDRKAYLARKSAEADAARKAAGGLASRLKKEELEGDTNTISEKGFDNQDRPTKKSGPSHKDLVATAKWMRKNKVDSNATAKNKKGSK